MLDLYSVCCGLLHRVWRVGRIPYWLKKFCIMLFCALISKRQSRVTEGPRSSPLPRLIVGLNMHCSFIAIHFFHSISKRAMFITQTPPIRLYCVKSLVEKARHRVIIIDLTTSCFSRWNMLKAAAAATTPRVISVVFKREMPT